MQTVAFGIGLPFGCDPCIERVAEGASPDEALLRPQSSLMHCRCSCRVFRASYRDEGRTMAVGTVKFFNTTKGYGFIAPDGASKNVFVHISAVERA